MKLDKSQKRLVSKATKYALKPYGSHKAPLVINAIGGAGKTFCIPYIMDSIEEQLELSKKVLGIKTQPVLDVVLTAPINSVIHQIYKQLPETPDRGMSTIYSLLGYKAYFKKDGDISFKQYKELAMTLVKSLIIVDEGSMIDKELFKNLWKQYGKENHIIIMGDEFQLLKVGAKVPYVYNKVKKHINLTKMHRSNSKTFNRYIERLRANVKERRIDAIPHGLGGIITQCTSLAQFNKILSKKFIKNPHKCKYITFTNRRANKYNKDIRYDVLRLDNLIQPDDVITVRGELTFTAVVTTLRKVVFKNPDNDDLKVLNSAGGPDGMNIQFTVLYTSRVYKIMVGPITLTSIKVYFNASNNPMSKSYIQIILSYEIADNSFLTSKMHKNVMRVLYKKYSWSYTYASTVHNVQGRSIDNVFLDLSNSSVLWNQSYEFIARFLYIALSRPRKQVYVIGKIPKFLIIASDGWKGD